MKLHEPQGNGTFARMKTLCRDCLTLADDATPHCEACGSSRCISHTALDTLSIAHVDCDAFFASVEKRDDPSLADRPVIVGGGRRGVVSTCCYIARLYGIRSAMPMFKALKACPEAVVVRPDYEKYRTASHQIRARMTALTPLVQVVSIDEAYLDLSGLARLHGAPPALLLARMAAEIEAEVGVTVSIGLSANKFLAKTASELDKPRGFSVISAEEAPALLAPRDPGFLHGVGPKLAARLVRDGYKTIGDLQSAPLKALIGAYGETGLFLHQRARGEDHRKVDPRSERKSVSSETTFETDLADLPILEDHLWHLSEKTAARAKAAGVEGAVVTLKLKTANFRTLTRRTTLRAPTQLAQAIFRAARPLLSAAATGERFRLIGVGLSELQEARADVADLLDPKVAKRAAAERAADKAREKFGRGAITTGRGARLDQTRTEKK